MKNATIIIAIVLVVFACVFYQQAALIPRPRFTTDVGPGAYPKMIAIILGMLSLALLVVGLSSSDKERFEPPKIRSWIIMGLAVGYMLILEEIGFIMSGIVLIFLMMVLLRPDSLRRTWLTIIATSIFVPFSMFYVFNNLLRVTLPRGLLETLF